MSASGETKGALAPIEMIVEAFPFFVLSDVEEAEDGVDVRAAGVGLSSDLNTVSPTVADESDEGKQIYISTYSNMQKCKQISSKVNKHLLTFKREKIYKREN